MVHSVIIGISLGASESAATVRPLVAALTFHQFFEGMGLGGCIAQVTSPFPAKSDSQKNKNRLASNPNCYHSNQTMQ